MTKALVRHMRDKGGPRYRVLIFWCPGCAAFRPRGSGLHALPVFGETSPKWDWNGDLERVTLSPSTRTSYKYHNGGDVIEEVCHSFLKGGVFEFLGDCTHELKNQKVALPDLPEWVERMFDGNEVGS